MKNRITSFFKTISGRPKNGNIVECIRPVIVIPVLILAIISMVSSIKCQQYGYGIMAMVLSWQIGWGMSIERFIKSEDDENE